MVKNCKTCDEEKSIKDFDKHPGMTDGHINVCKSCRHDYCKKWRSDNRKELKIKKAIYHEQVKSRVNEEKNNIELIILINIKKVILNTISVLH